MKKVINGRRYDTSTAQKIGEFDSGHFATDFEFFEESLYRKKTGEFFLHGSGGAFSKYSHALGNNSRGGGSAIVPLTEDEARAWVEERLDLETYEELFGEVEEEQAERFGVSLAVEEAQALRTYAAEKGLNSVQDAIRALARGLVQ